MNSTNGYLLIVEDDADILRLLETTLTFQGHRVVTARNGREGLAAVEQKHPDLIIADIMMPRLDGFGLVHRLRINPETRDIPVIFITATYVSEEDKDFALSIGATRFIQKPIDFERFLTTITEILHGKGAVVSEPVKEINFFEGYRQRLETKLKQKDIQIARDEELLGSLPEEERPDFLVSLNHAIVERQELKQLLEQIDQQLEKYSDK
jgi:DNA-binding response OmpR family regulator